MKKNTAKHFDQTLLKFVIPIAVLVLLTALSMPALANYNSDGFSVTTRTNGTVHGGVFIDSVPGAEDTQTGSFDVPTGNIKWAYLYTGIWGGTNRYEGWVNVTFNGDCTSNNLGPIWIRGQNDTNSNVWGSGCGKHWMYYNVTNLTNAGTTNIATVSKINATDPGGQFDGDPYGIVLVVVYEGGDNPKDLRYWINDGSDGLNHVNSHDAGTTDFDGAVDTDKVMDANLTMVHLTAYDPLVDDGLKFNGNTLDTSMIDTNAFELNSWDVTSYMESSGNDAWYTRCGDYPTCSIPESDGYINICNAILVLDNSPPDLNVTAIEVNPDYDAGHRELFANESNTISATIKNLDLNNNSNAFNVSFEIEGENTWKVPVSGLAAGASTDVSINWTPTSGGTVLSPVNYNLTVTADCDGEVNETDETNNASTKTLSVYNNGYKGKRYTGGSDIETEQMETLNGNLLYSKGNSSYQSGALGGGSWDSYTVHWTSGDLPVPGSATVKKARLYVYYNWDSSAAGINTNMDFNGHVFSMNDLDAHYKDIKGYGYYYDHKSGTMVYNVTEYFSVSGNTATLTKVVSNDNVAIFGMLLVVAYEDASEPKRLIWINEECDILDAIGAGSGSGNIGVNETEATAYAPFSGTIDSSKVNAATLITVAPAGDSGPGNEDRLYFNSGQWDDVWNGKSGEDISINETDVKGHLQSGSNLARMQSRGDYITATNAFLVIEYKSDAPDLVITDKWVCWPVNCTICYNVTNMGTITAAAGHNTTLYVDETGIVNDTVQVNLPPGASYIGCFNYTWTYTPPQDNITVCADSNNSVDEKSDEDNNCLTNEWKCGDGDNSGGITMGDSIQIFNNILYGSGQYPIDNLWAADVDGGGSITMGDSIQIFNNILHGSGQYPLTCKCCT